MTRHFDRPEYEMGQSRANQALFEHGLDALLTFAPESQFWICGYDTFGFAMFQRLVLTSEGELHLLTRMTYLKQAQITSTLPDDQIDIWPGHEVANPARDLAALLSDLGVTGRIGFESDTAGLSDKNSQAIRA